MYLKKENGVTLMALTVTIIIMLIISSTIIYSTNSRIQIQKIDKLYEDINNLNGKIDEYYLNYNDIPVLSSKQYCNQSELDTLLSRNASLHNSTLTNSDNKDVKINPNDNDVYYIIDVEKLTGLTLNYGYDDEFKNAKNSNIISTSVNNVYIINQMTHQIYYPSGIFANNHMYYTYNLNTTAL